MEREATPYLSRIRAVGIGDLGILGAADQENIAVPKDDAPAKEVTTGDRQVSQARPLIGRWIESPIVNDRAIAARSEHRPSMRAPIT